MSPTGVAAARSRSADTAEPGTAATLPRAPEGRLPSRDHTVSHAPVRTSDRSAAGIAVIGASAATFRYPDRSRLISNEACKRSRSCTCISPSRWILLTPNGPQSCASEPSLIHAVGSGKRCQTGHGTRSRRLDRFPSSSSSSSAAADRNRSGTRAGCITFRRIRSIGVGQSELRCRRLHALGGASALSARIRPPGLPSRGNQARVAGCPAHALGRAIPPTPSSRSRPRPATSPPPTPRARTATRRRRS